MYSICGVPLDNDAQGWYLQSATKALPGLSADVTMLRTPGRDGYQRLPAPRQAPRLIFVVRLPRAKLEALMSLFAQADPYLTLTADPTKRATFDLLAIDPEPVTVSEGIVDITVVIALPGVYWRSTDLIVSSPVTIANPVQNVDVLPGLSGRVNDAELFLGGAFSSMELRDSSGSWVRTTQAWTNPGFGLLYLAETGQAFTATAASPWVPITDVSNIIDVSGGDGFRIEPFLIGGDPTNRTGRIRVTTGAQTGVTFRVRARGAYLVS